MVGASPPLSSCCSTPVFTPPPVFDRLQGYSSGRKIQQLPATGNPGGNVVRTDVNPQSAVRMIGRFTDFVALVP